MIIDNCDKIVREIVDKVLTSMRPNVKQAGLDLLLDIYSIHRDDFEGFNEGLGFSFKAKTPK